MVSPKSPDCRQFAAACTEYADRPGTSRRRSGILKAMANSWKTLANQMDRLDAAQRVEDPELRRER